MPESKPQDRPQHHKPRGRSKPKFEVPADAGLPADAGWVYRDSADAPAAAAPATAPAAAAEPPVAHAPQPAAKPPAATKPPAAAHADPPPSETRAAPPPQHILSTAAGLFAIGLGVMGQICLTAFTLFAAPIRIARRRFMGD